MLKCQQIILPTNRVKDAKFQERGLENAGLAILHGTVVCRRLEVGTLIVMCLYFTLLRPRMRENCNHFVCVCVLPKYLKNLWMNFDEIYKIGRDSQALEMINFWWTSFKGCNR